MTLKFQYTKINLIKEEGIYGLKAAFEWGISEVVWQIEQNRKVLKDILAVGIAILPTIREVKV